MSQQNQTTNKPNGKPDSIRVSGRNDPSCVDCKKSYKKETFLKYDGERCGRCFKKENNINMEVDIVTKPNIINHRNAWLTYYADRFETPCGSCQKVIIDVFDFQSTFINGSLVPVCRQCCPDYYRRTVNKLSRDVWLARMGKNCVMQCPIHANGVKCQNTLNVWNFEKGHILARNNGGSLLLENLYPVCGPCNKGVGTRDMRDFL